MVGGVVRRERGAVLLAALLHALAFGLAPSTPRDAGPRFVSTPVNDAAQLEVAIEIRAEGLAAGTLPTAMRSTPDVLAAREVRAGSRPPRIPSAEATPAALASRSVAEGAASTWTLSATQAPDLTRLSLGPERYRGEIAATDGASPAPAPTTADRAFADATAHDVELGLSRGSPLVSAAREVASQADMLGTALFDVTLDGSGVRVDLARASGDIAEWDRLREPLARLVATRPIALSRRGHGLRVRIQVDAAVKLADGRDVRVLGNHAGATAGRVGGADGVTMKEMPSLFVDHVGKNCSARLGLGPTGGDLAAQTDFGVDGPKSAPINLASLLTPITVGGGCGVDNIGTPPRRMVAARVVSETTL